MWTFSSKTEDTQVRISGWYEQEHSDCVFWKINPGCRSQRGIGGENKMKRIFLFVTYTLYTEYNEEWNVFSVFNPSKCTHTWSSGHTHTTHTHTWSSGHTHTPEAVGKPTLWHPGSSRGFGALLKGLTSVVDNSCRSRDSNPQPRVTSPTLYPLGHGCPTWWGQRSFVPDEIQSTIAHALQHGLSMREVGLHAHL